MGRVSLKLVNNMTINTYLKVMRELGWVYSSKYRGYVDIHQNFMLADRKVGESITCFAARVKHTIKIRCLFDYAKQEFVYKPKAPRVVGRISLKEYYDIQFPTMLFTLKKLGWKHSAVDEAYVDSNNTFMFSDAHMGESQFNYLARVKKTIKTKCTFDTRLQEFIYESVDEKFKDEYLVACNMARKHAIEVDQSIKEENKMEKLYEYTVNDKTVYGTILTYNSEGKAVFEARDGTLQAVDADLLVRVMPFTFSVRFKPAGQDYHFKGEASKVSKGDYIIRADYAGYGEGFPICIVTDVDTKSESATKTLEGYNLSKQHDVQ